MTRTPFFWALIYVHTAIGVVALLASIAAVRAKRGSPEHRRAGWWFVQALAGLFVTTAMMASIRYTLFLFVIGYAAWYTSHQAWLASARRGDRPYLAGPLSRAVQDDLAVVLGLVLVAATIAMLFQRDYPITPYGLGLGVAFAWGGVLALLGWAARTGRMDRLRPRVRHVVHIGAAVTATWSEFFADVTVHFMRATFVWIVAWIVPALLVIGFVHRLVDLRACLALVLRGSHDTRPTWAAPPHAVPERRNP